MSTQPQGADAAAQGGSPQPAPSASPANPQQVMLAQIYQVIKRLTQENPAMSSGGQKVLQGLQEMQSASLTQRPSPSPEQNPPV